MAPAGALSMAIHSGGSFDPAKLSGLLYYVNADLGASITGGQFTSIADQSANALSFTQGTAAQQPTEDLVENPPHRYASTDTGDRMELVDGIAASLVGVNFTWWCAFRSLSNSTINPVWQHYAGVASTGNMIAVVMGDGTTLSSTGMSIRVRDAGGFGTAHVAFTRDITTRHLIVIKYTFSTRTAQLFKDNVSQGSAALDVSRNPVGLDHSVVFGGGAASQSAKIGTTGVVLGLLSTANTTALYNWHVAQGWL